MVISKGKGDANGRRGELSHKVEEKASPARKYSLPRFHNFSFPMTNWGCQRLLRCVNPEAETPNRFIPTPDKEEEEQEDTSSPAARPWNLRIRRSSYRDPAENCYNRCPCPSSSFSHLLLGNEHQGRADLLRSEGGGEKPERPKFYVSLSREEIEEDFFAFIGLKPSRRPKKRARIVQRQLDSIFPGLWLSEVTVDSYRVNE
ncbi:hypothetical protein AXF42_Ash018124 [Apostasia shenzhenica]|uniref:Uncharacterized protein n=1 Tax=Apostasia shenzhenica TaxID=1088818 RepID=A0A2I0AEX4_9ASPA|nr:hypothetical protein AXF42_Ash018124 [Apostasia shenzhenica]